MPRREYRIIYAVPANALSLHGSRHGSHRDPGRTPNEAHDLHVDMPRARVSGWLVCFALVARSEPSEPEPGARLVDPPNPIVPRTTPRPGEFDREAVFGAEPPARMLQRASGNRSKPAIRVS